jgi:hypothetical protein
MFLKILRLKIIADEIFSLTILPLLFRPTTIKSKGPGKHWLPSKVEIQSGFLLHIKLVQYIFI